jgi:hypothetical protein
MIDRREILEAASSFSLLPSIVEKDYFLGWMLEASTRTKSCLKAGSSRAAHVLKSVTSRHIASRRTWTSHFVMRIS